MHHSHYVLSEVIYHQALFDDDDVNSLSLKSNEQASGQLLTSCSTYKKSCNNEIAKRPQTSNSIIYIHTYTYIFHESVRMMLPEFSMNVQRRCSQFSPFVIIHCEWWVGGPRSHKVCIFWLPLPRPFQWYPIYGVQWPKSHVRSKYLQDPYSDWTCARHGRALIEAHISVRHKDMNVNGLNISRPTMMQ